jgi:hypothetical protein
MGFFDKVLSKVGATLATRYASVVNGKYSACKIALGNPPHEKISVADSFSQIIFLNENEEMGRYNIATDFASIEYNATSATGYRCTLTFANGETSEIDLFKERAKVFVLNTRSLMLKETYEVFEKELNL